MKNDVTDEKCTNFHICHQIYVDILSNFQFHCIKLLHLFSPPQTAHHSLTAAEYFTKIILYLNGQLSCG